MVPIHKFEAKKGVGGSRGYAKAKSQAWPQSKEEHYLHLVGLGGHATLGNARKEWHSQQRALHSPDKTIFVQINVFDKNSTNLFPNPMESSNGILNDL